LDGTKQIPKFLNKILASTGSATSYDVFCTTEFFVLSYASYKTKSFIFFT